MSKLFWMVHGDAASSGWGGNGDIYGNGFGGGDNGGFGDGWGNGDGYGLGNGDGYGLGNGYGDGVGGNGAGDGGRIPALAIPRTLEAHAVVAAVLGRLP